jgi:transcriptional regulator with XRE-family HTH domain
MSKQFGDRLRELRIERNLTQEQLAKIFNTGKASISHYESNRRIPDVNMTAKYASFFNVTVDYMIGKSDIRNPYQSEDISKQKPKAYHDLDKSDLPEEALKQIDDYIEFIKQKYGSAEK